MVLGVQHDPEAEGPVSHRGVDEATEAGAFAPVQRGQDADDPVQRAPGDVGGLKARHHDLVVVAGQPGEPRLGQVVEVVACPLG